MKPTVMSTKQAQPGQLKANLSHRERLLGKAYRLFYDHPIHIATIGNE